MEFPSQIKAVTQQSVKSSATRKCFGSSSLRDPRFNEEEVATND